MAGMRDTNNKVRCDGHLANIYMHAPAGQWPSAWLHRAMHLHATHNREKDIHGTFRNQTSEALD